MDKIEPINRNIVIKPIEKMEKDNGLYLGSEENYTCGRGEVLEVAGDCKSKIKKKNTVVYRLLGQSDFNLNGEKVHIVKEENIDGILK